MSGTESIEIQKLQPHPQNPRVSVREDVVSAIAAQLADGFDPAHALIVRPVGNDFEIISGHHRHEAARRAGIEHVPCWVREMDDATAYMALATSNSQGELSPLELGMHALHCVGLSEGGRGKKGGLSAYAEKVGKDTKTLRQCRDGAAVAEKVGVDPHLLQTKTQHLAAIHALPESCWQAAVEIMLDKGWTAKETSEKVKACDANTDKRRIALLTGQTTARELARIDELAQIVADGLQYDDLVDRWKSWLADNDPVDVKPVQDMRVKFEDEAHARRTEENEDTQATLPQLVLADPPWRYEFAQSDSRQIENQYPSATPDEIIDHRPETESDCVLLLWATATKLPEALEVMHGWGFKYVTQAVWDKEKIGMGYWFRGQHELLLVGKKGEASPPAESVRVSSVFREKRGKHSEKPQCVYEWIESAFPTLNKLEMYCRSPRDGWQSWGNESNE